MIDQICQYSIIILLGNVAVLLIVAITTDYWEYRGFDRDKIEPALKNSNRTILQFPPDTRSYFSIYYLQDDNAKIDLIPGYTKTYTAYQPPAYIGRYVKSDIKMTNNLSYVYSEPALDVIVLFEQYGNLFRDCDNLEAGVRKRLEMTDERDERCHHFIVKGRHDDYLQQELPFIVYLERSAFALSVVSIAAIVTSMISGMYGSVAKYKRAIITASVAALISGTSLTSSIALFHVKCHLIKRREFMDGKEVPFKSIIDKARSYSYGWSFVLAWICVALCFISSWTWLHKSQDMKVRYRPRRVHRNTYYAYKEPDFL